AKGADGGLDFGGVLRGDGDLLTPEFDGAAADGGGDLAVDGGGDRDDVGELEIGNAELSEAADEAVGLRAADAGVFGTELVPGNVKVHVGCSVPYLLEACHAGGGAMVRKDVEGLFAAYPGPYSEGGLGFGSIAHRRSFWKTDPGG